MIGTSLDPDSFLAGFVSALALSVTLAGFLALLFSHTDSRGLSRRTRREARWAELSRQLREEPAIAPNGTHGRARTTVDSETETLPSLSRSKRHRTESK